METIFERMIEYAYTENNYEVADMVKDLLSQFAFTCNCPSNWRGLGTELMEKYKDNDWIMEYCELYEFEE